jgi:hypothetical protein
MWLRQCAWHVAVGRTGRANRKNACAGDRTMPQRLKAEEVRRRMKSDGVLLVCAYDDADKCRQLGIAESIPYPDFKSRLESVPKSQEIVFFCA